MNGKQVGITKIARKELESDSGFRFQTLNFQGFLSEATSRQQRPGNHPAAITASSSGSVSKLRTPAHSYLCPMHKAGFVNIIGNPNAGKSTLMNALVGERISIITSKAQTTRHRIMGIVNGEDFQVVYSDTPGIIKPKYKLQSGMMQFVGTALADADILLLVTDLTDDSPIDPDTFEKIVRAPAAAEQNRPGRRRTDHRKKKLLEKACSCR
jgi:ribosome biogenesis GTPase A